MSYGLNLTHSLKRLVWRAALVLALALMGVSFAACGDDAGKQTVASGLAQRGIDEGPLTVVTQQGTFTFRTEVVDTPETRAKGLMFREDMAPDQGMLFDFDNERPVSFWMRNTFIALDMVFVAADGTVRSIHANAVPQDPTSIPSGAPVRFVFEIPGGRAAEIGLAPGDRLQHARIQPAN